MADPTRGLYPFLDDDRTSSAAVADRVLTEVRESTLAKARDVTDLREALWARSGDALCRAAQMMSASFRDGGRVLAFGNGGSATDAEDLVADLLHPPFADADSLPALDLGADPAILTALTNDIGPDHVFLRQLGAYGRPGDVAVGFSTSGRSGSVVEALREAARRGLGTVAFTGYDGGVLRDADWLDVLVVAPSQHIPRIQEAHATAYHTLLVLVRHLLASDAPRSARSMSVPSASSRPSGHSVHPEVR